MIDSINPSQSVLLASDLSNHATTADSKALISGGIAGTTVDCALHPLDTFRTRLQSEKGFWASGHVRNVGK